MSNNPPASGVRVPWEDVPRGVRARVEDFLGARVTGAETQNGGFSPAAAVRLGLQDGRRAFVKALEAAPYPQSVGIYRDEARIAARLPDAVPAPRLLTHFEQDGWVVLVFEDVDGRHPRQPWDRAELDRVLRALGEMSAALTPSPVDAPPIGEKLAESFTGWRRLLEEDTTGLDPWALANLERLAELEAGWAEAAKGDTLLHADVRADNILLTEEGVFFVDWPHACLGAPWVDLLALLPSVRMQGGPPPHELLDDPDPAITAVLAAITGYFVRQGRRPDPPGLPTVRAFQRAQGVVALEWLRERLENG
ncbi:aminoglycoside phosphotransferase family protein [Thermoactinospora rubra]|uniref:aminoglycoside phosphotransferase family protein n=1 Tax=Thermoactinospora rubra TaxID=1088767 RepID=UPI000A0FFDE3|nr:aminoglycoside phosphotransferase family protein [Thermoactinospora rubra]